uniref:Uncharacterized protein n=1 Tax=Oryza glumipatula TaxID=40148 RepID=A0A0E0AX22_9ORYZ
MAESKKRGIRDWIGLFFLLSLSSRPPRLRLAAVKPTEADGASLRDAAAAARWRETNSGKEKNSKHLPVGFRKIMGRRWIIYGPRWAAAGRAVAFEHGGGRANEHGGRRTGPQWRRWPKKERGGGGRAPPAYSAHHVAQEREEHGDDGGEADEL